MRKFTRVDEHRTHEVLTEVEYPVSRDVLVEKLRVYEPDMIDALEHIPDRDYQSIQDLEEALAAAS